MVQPEKRSKKKTDRRDAGPLCEILWINRRRLLAGKRVQRVRRVQLSSQEDADARQVTELRKRLGQLRTRTINRIKHLLRKHNLEQECPTKGLDTIRGRTACRNRQSDSRRDVLGCSRNRKKRLDDLENEDRDNPTSNPNPQR
ncbi:MAG TPA: hypothetical protein VMY37_06200 [Thermoguttaceae bacterium]|nr:hypothetical protein [Thermoguttaceae bacterium]